MVILEYTAAVSNMLSTLVAKTGRQLQKPRNHLYLLVFLFGTKRKEFITTTI